MAVLYFAKSCQILKKQWSINYSHNKNDFVCCIMNMIRVRAILFGNRSSLVLMNVACIEIECTSNCKQNLSEIVLDRNIYEFEKTSDKSTILIIFKLIKAFTLWHPKALINLVLRES